MYKNSTKAFFKKCSTDKKFSQRSCHCLVFSSQFVAYGSDINIVDVTDKTSTCLVCGKKDRSVEFILPDRYCSQSCADKHG